MIAARRHYGAAVGAMLLCGLGAAGLARAQTQIGAWNVSVQSNLHSRPVKTAILLAPDGTSLIASCDARGADLLISYIDRLPTVPDLPVLWRIDGGAAHHQTWQESPDHGALSPGAPGLDGRVLKQFARGRRLTVSAAGRHTSFDLYGARQVANLIGDCPPVSAATQNEPRAPAQ